MAIVLTSAQHQEIFNQIKSSFSDFCPFDQVADQLKKAIIDSDNIELNSKTIQKVAERYFDVKSFKCAEKKLEWVQIQLIFKTCYVLILSHQARSRSLLWDSTDTLIEKYPQFEGIDSEELQLLLNFRNMVKVTLTLIPAKLNKDRILKIASHLEGSQNNYVTGGGQKPAVERRVKIYEQEGNITAAKRPDRKPSATTEYSESGKRKASTTSKKNTKRMSTDSDEDHRMCPLSSLSNAASRMLNTKRETSGSFPVAALVTPDPSNAAASLAVANVPSDTNNPIGMYMLSSTSEIWKETLRQQPAGMTAVEAGSAVLVPNLSSLPLETNDHINEFLTSSCGDFWKETSASHPEEIRQQPGGVKRDVSRSINMSEVVTDQSDLLAPESDQPLSLQPLYSFDILSTRDLLSNDLPTR